MSWKDRQNSAVLAGEPGPAFPWIQWVNSGSQLDPRRNRGGFFITIENLNIMGNPAIIGLEPSGLVFSGGDSERGGYMPVLEVAVLADRFGWRVQGDGGTYNVLPDYQPGARGKRQCLALVRLVDDHVSQPVVVTLTGTVTNGMGDAITAHRQAVRTATAGRGATAWFWMRIVAGEPEQRGKPGQSSMVTPINYAPDGEFDPDALYIGDDAADMIEEMWPEIERWAAEWENGQAGDDEDAVEPQQQQAPPQAPQPAQQRTRQQNVPQSNQAPAKAPHQPQGSYSDLGQARASWSKAWNELKGKGVTGPFLDNSWKVEQIFEAEGAMRRALASLDAGQGVNVVAAELSAAFSSI